MFFSFIRRVAYKKNEIIKNGKYIILIQNKKKLINSKFSYLIVGIFSSTKKYFI